MTEVEAIVASLWELDDDVLEAQLGSRVQAIGDDVAGRGARGVDPASLESIDVNFAARAAIDQTFLDAGRQLFDRVNPLLYQLMCKPLGDDGETQKILDETHIPHPQLAHMLLEGVKVNHPRPSVSIFTQ